MLLRVFLSLVIILSSTLSIAAPKAYIDVDDSLFSSPRLVIDGKEMPMGFMGFSNVPEAMESNPLAKALASDYVLYRNWGTGLLFGGLAAALIYLSTSHTTGPDKNFEESTYWGLFLAGFLPGAILQGRAQTKLIRAVNQYNGVYDSDDKKAWELTPSTKGLGLALRF